MSGSDFEGTVQINERLSEVPALPEVCPWNSTRDTTILIPHEESKIITDDAQRATDGCLGIFPGLAIFTAIEWPEIWSNPLYSTPDD
jgi:hypothetical protein